MTTSEEALEAIEKARLVVNALCDGSLKWSLSVPARPESDPDLVIADALRKAKTVLTAPRAAADTEREALPKPAGKLHDDGYFTWNGPTPYKANFAGWRANFYTEDQMRAALSQPAKEQEPLTAPPKDCGICAGSGKLFGDECGPTCWNRERPTAPPQAEARPEVCGCCHGSGRMVRDPDIGTDQECFACDGTWVIPQAEAQPANAEQVVSKVVSGKCAQSVRGSSEAQSNPTVKYSLTTEQSKFSEKILHLARVALNECPAHLDQDWKIAAIEVCKAVATNQEAGE